MGGSAFGNMGSAAQSGPGAMGPFGSHRDQLAGPTNAPQTPRNLEGPLGDGRSWEQLIPGWQGGPGGGMGAAPTRPLPGMPGRQDDGFGAAPLRPAVMPGVKPGASGGKPFMPTVMPGARPGTTGGKPFFPSGSAGPGRYPYRPLGGGFR